METVSDFGISLLAIGRKGIDVLVEVNVRCSAVSKLIALRESKLIQKIAAVLRLMC